MNELKQSFNNFPESTSSSSENKVTLLETMKQSAQLHKSLASVGKILRNYDISNIGNKSYSEDTVLRDWFREHPIAGYALVLSIPVVEEIIFRGLPNLFLNDKSNKLHWRVGVSQALLFSLGHNLTFDDKDKLSFMTNAFPIPQFIAGLYLWKVSRERGFLHSTLAHIAFNFF